MPTSDKDSSITKHQWNTALATLYNHLIQNRLWVLIQDSRYSSLITKGTIPSKDLIVCSTPTQARQLVNRTASLYSWDDPAPIAIPSFAQLQVLDGLPAWALGAGGRAAHLASLAAATATHEAAAAAIAAGLAPPAVVAPVHSAEDTQFLTDHAGSVKCNASIVDIVDTELANV